MGVIIAGVDEAGRGPLAGPVVAAAVILDDDRPIAGLRDSKKLSAKKREYFSEIIKNNATAFAIAQAEADEIDKFNILQASLLAMRRAVEQLATQPEQVLVDGSYLPDLSQDARAIVGGDNLEDCISAASILAKVARDQIMQSLDLQYPDYGFAQHKGYPTKQHLAAIAKHGIIKAIYRCSFAPVRRYL